MPQRDARGRFTKHGDGQPLTADEFADALTIEVPQELEARLGEVYFDSVSQLYEAIASETPVDTGYLRASLGITVEGGELASLPPRDPRAGSRQYEPMFADADANAIENIGEAVATLAPLTIVFRAAYAEFVEARRGMVKRAKARWGEFVERAINNARD